MRSPRTATNSSPRSPQLEKARVQQRRPNTAKKKKKKKEKCLLGLVDGETYQSVKVESNFRVPQVNNEAT